VTGRQAAQHRGLLRARTLLGAGRLAAWVLIGLGAAGFATSGDGGSAERVRASGEFWEAVDPQGDILSSPRNLGGVTLDSEDSLRFRDLGADFAWRSLRLEVQKLSSTAILEIRLHADDSQALVLGVIADEPLGLFFAETRTGAPPAILKKASVPNALKNAYTPFRIHITRTADAVAVSVDGHPVLELPGAGTWQDLPVVGTRNGPCALRNVSITGAAARSGAGRTDTTHQENLLRLQAQTPWRKRAAALGIVAMCLAVAALFLRSLCLGRPTRAELLDAVSAWGALAALPFAIGAVPGVAANHFAAALGATAGLALAVFALRKRLLAREAPRRLGEAALVLASVLVVVPCLVTLVERTVTEPAGDVSTEQPRVRSAARSEEAVAEQALAAAGIPGRAELDAGNALVGTAANQDLEITATAVLQPDAILEIRVRADAPPHTSGLALFVSSDARVSSSFVRETSRRFDEIGSTSGAVAAGVPCAIHLRVSGGEARATIAGLDLRATAEPTSHDGLVFVAARGGVSLSDIRVSCPAVARAPSRLPPGALRLAGLVLLWVIALAAALAWLGGFPAGRASFLAAAALAPLAILGARIQPASDAVVPGGMRAAFVVALVLLLPVLVHARRLAGLALAALVALSMLTPPAVAFLALTGGGDLTTLLPTSWNYVGWTGERTARDLVALQHPVIRLLNDYLGAHRFRGREFALAKPAGSRRVLVLGGSSTWGYGLPESEHAEYPAVLETLLGQDLAARGTPVEVLNGAYQGATGARLFRCLRDGLLAFRPDVVVLSLTYNDCFALTRFDEDAWLDEFAQPGSGSSCLAVARTVRDLTRGELAMKHLLVEFGAERGSAPELWTALGKDPDDTPPGRFERVLRRYAQLAREEHFRLVLVKEPVAGDRRFLWKEEFRAAMDRVGADFDVPVVDPTPALQAAGGEALFQDDVHPRPQGHAIIADVLRPVIEAALNAH